MAVDKSFVVKNGLEVNSDLIVADASTKKVGIASTAPRSTLDVRGGIAATDINITGIATIANLQVADGDVDLTNLKVTGFSTFGGVSVDQLRVTGFTTFADISYDEITGRNITITGIATIPTFDGLTSFTDGVVVTGISTYAEIDTTNLNVSGVSTIATVDINAGDIEVSNVDTTDLNVTGVGTIASARIVNLNATGVSTIASLSVTGSTFDRLTVNNFSNLSGITTIDDPILAKATVSGVVTAAQFIGAGQIGIGTSGGLVGYGVSFLDFRGPGFTTAQFNSAVGIVTLNFQGGGGSGSASIGVGSTPGDAFTGIITAGNLWYNTGLGRLFIYYQDDNSAQWVDAAPFNVGIITQLTSVAFSTGTVAAPSLTFGNESDRGFFAPASGELAYSSGGVGIVTFNSTGVLAKTYFGDGSNLTGIDATSIKDSGGNVKVQGNPNGIVVTGIVTGSTANFTGVVTASSFEGDGSNLTNLPAGLGTALSSDNTSPLNKIYFTDRVLSIASTITIDPPATAIVAYTQYPQIEVEGDADLIISDGDEFIPNILGIGTTGTLPATGKSGGRVRADNFSDASGTGAPTFNAGVNVTGVVTASSASFTGNVTIGGTLTYQDVSHIDSVGIITAQQGIQVLANGLDITGVGTFKSDISIADKIIHTGDTNTAIRFPAADTFTVETAGSEAVRVDSSQRLLVGTDTAATAVPPSESNASLLQVGATNNPVSIGLVRSDTSISSGNIFGGIHWYGTDTTSNTPTIHASIQAAADGAHAAGDNPSRLTFSTTSDGASSVTERLRITSTGGFHFTNGELIERAKVTAGKLSDNTNIDLENGMVHLFTTTETTTSTPNIRINSSTSLNSVMANGEMISVTLITTAAAAGYSAQLTIDGSAVTENWTGGSAPSDGGSSGVDIYAYTIIKTADATFTVIATQTKTS